MQTQVKWIIGFSVIIGVILLIFIIVAIVIGSKKADEGPKIAKLTRPKYERDERVKKESSSSQSISKEVFYVNTGDEYQFKSPKDAQKMCQEFGCHIATLDQVERSFKSGAEWCGYGWTADGRSVYPMGEHADRCEGVVGLIEDKSPVRAGALCYGIKPPLNTLGVLPFNPRAWSVNDF